MTTRPESPGFHPAEEDLVLHHYGEAGRGGAVASHLSVCGRCRSELERIAATLALAASEPVPERGPDYEAEVWRRLRPRLEPRAAGPLLQARAPLRRWAMAAAVVLMVVSAFLAGRFTRPPVAPDGAIPGPVRERILLVAVGDHLERSQMMLVELLNADGGPSVDIAGDRRRASELVSAGRIYRRSAEEAGDAAIASVLEELERVLLDVAHGPDTLSHAELEGIQRRIRERGILLKVRLIGSQVREKGKTAAGDTGRRV